MDAPAQDLFPGMVVASGRFPRFGRAVGVTDCIIEQLGGRPGFFGRESRPHGRLGTGVAVRDRPVAYERLRSRFRGDNRRHCEQIRRKVADKMHFPAPGNVMFYLMRTDRRFENRLLYLAVETALYPDAALNACRRFLDRLAHEGPGRFGLMRREMARSLPRRFAADGPMRPGGRRSGFMNGNMV